MPGSARPSGLGLAPESPPVPPAPGGRAPSFGAPAPPGDWSFRIGGRVSGWESVGLGRRPAATPAGYSGTALHVPPVVTGRQPFFPGAGATLNLDYGNSVINATVIFFASFSGKEFQGYYNPTNGPAFGQAYLTITPAPLGPLRLQLRAGAFTENYGGPGQWGWGIYGPMLAVRGYGERISGELDITPDLRLTLAHGLFFVPGVPEAWVRGDYDPWIETGVSTWVNHAHATMTYKNQYVVGLHYASAYGTDERKTLRDILVQPKLITDPRYNGRMDVLVLETRWLADPYGQLGLSLGFWNFKRAAAVGDGIWWGLDWTHGAREMVTKFISTPSIAPQTNPDGTPTLNPNCPFKLPDNTPDPADTRCWLNPGRQYGTGTGKLAAISAEYDTSLARILWHPRNFDGRGPDVRIAIAGIYYKTLDTDDPFLKNATGYFAGTEIEYRMLSFFSFTLQSYIERRWTNFGPWRVFSASPGIAFHSDWVSTDRIQIAYSRRWYNQVADPNPAAPLDQDILTVGGYMTF